MKAARLMMCRRVFMDPLSVISPVARAGEHATGGDTVPGQTPRSMCVI
jgi:hypothetical protein